MVSKLDSESSGPGLSTGWSHCVVVLGQTLNSYSASLSTQEFKWAPGNCKGNLTKCWGVTCDGLASHPGRVAILLIANRFMLQKLGYKAPAVTLVQTLPKGDLF